MRRISLKVNNMKCAGCVNSVSGALQQLEGITGVEIELSSGMVSFDAPEGKALMAQLTEQLKRAGYPIVEGSIREN